MSANNNRNLNADEQQELDNWLNAKQIVLNHRTRRDLSDVVNMALLFKSIVPKLVNMKNYTSHGNLAAKLLNWETFSLKVLRKTGYMLMRPALELLASGDLISIRALLYHLMQIERDGMPLSSRNRTRSPPGKAQSQPDPIEFQQGKSMNNLPENENLQSMIVVDPSSKEMDEITKTKYNELMLINESKEEFINMLNNKSATSESVITDKEKRISQLLGHLTTLTVRIISMNTPRSEELT